MLVCVGIFGEEVQSNFQKWSQEVSELQCRGHSGKFHCSFTTSHFNLAFAKRNLVSLYKFAFCLTSFFESGSRVEGVLFYGIGVGFCIIRFPEYCNAFCGL